VERGSNAPPLVGGIAHDEARRPRQLGRPRRLRLWPDRPLQRISLEKPKDTWLTRRATHVSSKSGSVVARFVTRREVNRPAGRTH
jgi:hypothetical protein